MSYITDEELEQTRVVKAVERVVDAIEPDDVRCPRCYELKSKAGDRFAVVILMNNEGQEKSEVWCQDCADATKPQRVN